MKIRNEFVVAAPIEETWAALLDVPRVARALPGATIESDGAAGVYRGAIKVRLGPVTTEYRGVAELQEADDDARVATFRVSGREAHGQGTATATIRNELAPADDGTRVTVETELEVTGRAAQFGRGIMEDVAARLLAEFAARLEAQVLTASPGVERVAPGQERDGEVLDVGDAVWASLVRRPAVGAVAGALVGLALGFLLTRRDVVIVVVEKRR